jgi:peptide/nickel transport system ATP-binding protein
MALLEVRNLTISIIRGKKYYTAVYGINFKIEAGEIIALAGESGSGKSLTALSIPGLLSTRAKIIGGDILFSTDETIDLCKTGERSLRSIRGKEISMIFQEPRQSLNPLMKAGAQITEALKLHNYPSAQNKKTANRLAANKLALEMLEKLQFPQPEKIMDAWPHQLSGGMCQRVMIAIAAICRPRLLIADEPTTALDTVNQNHILALLKQINREFGTAILFISHDISVARDFCNRFMVMYSGRIIEEGPSEAILSSPLHPYTLALANAIPCKENRGKPLANIPGRAPPLEETPIGCHFASRCPKMQEKCRKSIPPLAEASSGRYVRCFFPEENRASLLQRSLQFSRRQVSGGDK